MGLLFNGVLYVCRVADSSCSKILPFKQDVMLQRSAAIAHWYLAPSGGAEQKIIVKKKIEKKGDERI